VEQGEVGAPAQEMGLHHIYRSHPHSPAFIMFTHDNHVYLQLSWLSIFFDLFLSEQTDGAPLGSNLFFTPRSPAFIAFTRVYRVYPRLSRSPAVIAVFHLHLLQNLRLLHFLP
jgi:hypothetical protein